MTKVKKKVMAARRTFEPFIDLNMHDWRMSMFTGVMLGMLIVSAPHLIGALLLLGLILVSIQLIAKDRL